MYLNFFGLRSEPFSIAPDPRFLFMSERHGEALAHLRYGLQSSGGFVVLSGEIGAGKTTLCRCLMEQVPELCEVAYLFNPKLTERELLQSVCADFGIDVPPGVAGAPSVKDLIDALNAHLLANHAQGRHSVLIIDEAQALSAALLEQLRLLTNLETHERKLLQIVLIGQPELRDMLERPELEQLAQRVVARFHLDTLTAPETEQYIRHRLSVAGSTGAIPFDAESLRRIHQLSKGVPRRINLLCDRALLGAYAEGRPQVRRRMVDQAASEVFGTAPLAARMRPGARWAQASVVAATAVAGLLVASWMSAGSRGPATTARATAAGTAASAASMASAASGHGAAASLAAASAAASAPALQLPPVEPWLGEAELATRLGRATTDEQQAWRDLAVTWLLTPLDGDPCTATAALGVHCFKRKGTLALLRQLDRPTLLPLYGADGVAHFAQLLGVLDGGARLRLDGRAVRVTPDVLATAWRGEFGTLWRAPPGYRLDASAASGTRVDARWLGTQLARASGAASAPAMAPVEGRLRAAVMAFQQSQGLEADGQAGSLTLMQLNRVAGVDEPHLPR
jgi:general secretion pathway protein A